MASSYHQDLLEISKRILIYLYDSGPPEKPQFLRATQTTAYTLELRWIPGFDGGHDQTFVIQYITKTGSCVNITVNPTDSDDDPQIYELSGLQPSNVYEVKLCSQNKIGTSPHTDPIMVSTSHSGKTPRSNINSI